MNEPSDDQVTTAEGRPNFAGFAAALRAEAHWLAEIHTRDNTGQSASDQAALSRLADYVMRVGRRLGYEGSRPAPSRIEEKLETIRKDLGFSPEAFGELTLLEVAQRLVDLEEQGKEQPR